MTELAFAVQPYDGIQEHLDTLLSFDIHSLGLGELDPVDYFDRNAPNQAAIDLVSREIGRRGMKVVTMHGVGGFVSPDPSRKQQVIQHLKREIDRAASWGSSRIVFHHRQVSVRWTRTEMADWSSAIGQMGVKDFDAIYHETLAVLAEYAGRQNVTIYLEAMGPPFVYGQCVEQILPTLRAIRSANLGVCVDTGHLHLSGHDPAAQIRLTKNFPLTLHLNDNLGPIGPCYDIYDSDLHLIPGLGTINWPGVISALREVGYQDPFFFEGPHYRGATFKDCVEMTVRNWRLFEQLAKELQPQL
jgi:sugar phosphate isomerase/epimerase